MTDSSDPSLETLREFLDAEKARPDPLPEVQERIFSRLAASLAFSPDLGSDPASSAPAHPSPSRPGATGQSLARAFTHVPYRTLATFLVGAAAGATGYATVAQLRQDSKLRNPAPPPAQIAPRSPPAVMAEPKPAPSALPANEATPREPGGGASYRRNQGEPAAARSRDEGLAAERNLIEIARTALARGRLDGALATLHRHARLYPKGQLAEERDSLLVQALVAEGDYAQARALAARFRRRHPSSLFLPAVDQALRSIP